ncbi:8934_t:CDS:1 [Paraglomus brasilianum]|uniref:8934_t:CDS:1 n=1 Tax=Paraglomus brasilianum TaxID=144538 RepID=A0A9N9FEM4_9GLOM|nr:8934_t:CDS:1 [Paraglomus brasilianum]
MKSILITILLLLPFAYSDTRECGAVTATRDGLKAAALWTVQSQKTIQYTQDIPTRWSGIDNHTCPFTDVPAYADCSSFVTWLYWSAFGLGPDYLNGENWSAGYTGSMGTNGITVSLTDAQPGGVVLYGVPPYDHAVMYIGDDGNGNNGVSFGITGPAILLNINYRNDFVIESYPNFFTQN